MDLEKIKIENFKCFHSQTEIELGKITLLTGANSSGKSSIIYSILGSIQSGEFPFQFSTNGKFVNMGDFREIVYNHDKKGEIKLGFTFKNGSIQEINTIWKEDIVNNLPKLYQLKAKSEYFDLSITYKSKKYIVDLKYDPSKDPQYKIFSPENYKKFITNITGLIGENKPNPNKKIENEKDFGLILEEMTKPQDFKGLEIEESLFGKNILSKKGNVKLQQIFEIVAKTFNNYDKNINFISSFRLHPDRGYLETSKAELKVGNDGNGYLDQIMYWENKTPKKFKELLTILQELNLLEEIKPKRTDGGKYDLLVKTKKNGIFTSLYDVGFGISQFLPIIVADLQLPKESTLFIAQPEIHLHPSIQSSFGDYLTNQIKVNSKKYVVETHSEYLLNKIRLSIVKGEINQDDVKIIFVDNQGEKNILHKIVFNKSGQILNAPENFFKTYMMDVMEIAINASE